MLATAVLVDINGLLFEDTEDHMFDTGIEDNHIRRLVKLVCQCYTKVRLYQLDKDFTQEITGSKIRKNLSKLILFNHH